jgi:hypothetical protein
MKNKLINSLNQLLLPIYNNSQITTIFFVKNKVMQYLNIFKLITNYFIMLLNMIFMLVYIIFD